MKFPSAFAASLLAIVAATASAQDRQDPAATAHPEQWPAIAARPRLDPKIEARVDRLLEAMSLEDKVGQIIQADIATITPEDLRTYKLGSVLNGGNSAPNKDEFAPPAEWLKLADRFYDASMARSDGRPKVPVLWGTDAVHGNNNIVGATLFPHNIGLGAARDPGLMREIGQVTAEETAAAGLDWSFAPTLAVTQDDRWGRTYESYSEDPAVVASYAGQVVEGLQGKVMAKGMAGKGHVIATAKHFLADGGTLNGKDQGDARISEATLRDIHAAGYRPALEAGALTVMASFSSWNGAKMTGNKSLLTGVLKERWGFPGFVVGDWNAHGQVPGCSNVSCPTAINAGLDMFMMSGDWKQLYANTLAQAKSGEIPMARLDDAVRRILRVKLWSGLFEAGRPSSRPLAGKFDLIGSARGKEVARRAVRESMVLLKNNGQLLPLKPAADILIAGKAADSIAQQSGGWSITWQGTNVPNSGFPNATSIRQGIEDAVKAGGGKASYAADGSYATRPDAAIVVFGETPYAEFMGDRPDLEYSPSDKSDLALLRKLKAAGIPVVAVFLSGRPMWVNAELNASDAFVAAFLPGSEGAGVADMLFRTRPAYDFRGKLSFSWPKRLDQAVLNRGDANYDPLFAFGYGLTYASKTDVPQLDETRPAGARGDASVYFSAGRVPEGWSLALRDQGGSSRIGGNSGRSASGALEVFGVDRNAQEDARRFVWKGNQEAAVTIGASHPLDLSREANGQLSLLVQYRVDEAPTGPVALGMTGAGKSVRIDLGTALRQVKPGNWKVLAVPLGCFAGTGLNLKSVDQPFELITGGRFTISISDVRIGNSEVPPIACP
jgi:beta-glucosidase